MSKETKEPDLLYTFLQYKSFLEAKRSLDDIKSLSNEKFNVRICKGIYVENPELVLNDYNDIRQNFICLFSSQIRFY